MPELLERLRSALGDRYAVESEIGHGGMAVVFLAEDLRHHRRVALKVLHPELTATLGAERFLYEIEIIAGLQHPHILPLYESGEADGLLYYVMPYARGESLRQRLDREKQLAVDESVRIVVEVADGLDYAHRQGVVHRDIKPGNILLAEGHAVIADFGIARAIEAARADRVTRTGLAVGTPLYASPEQATAQETLDGRTDIYSLGCVTYEMLAGEPPLTGSTPQMIQARRLSETPTALHTLRDTVPPALDHVITRALARIPADRYATASQFGQALQAALFAATPAATAKPATTPGALATTPTAAAPGKRRSPATRWLSPVVGLAVVAAVAAVVWMQASDRSVTRDARLLSVGADLGDRSIAVLPFENNTGVDSLDWLSTGTGVAGMLTTDLAQLEAVRVVSVERLLDLFRQAGHEETERIHEDQALNVAAASGARAMINGSLVKLGHDFRLDARLIDLSDGTIISAEQARGSDIFALVDEVSARLLSQMLGETITPTELRPLSELATGNLEAYREYQAGLLAEQRFLGGAAEHYQRAVELDSTFALAWLRLGLRALHYTEDLELATSHLERAERYSADASERDHLLIQAGLARASGKFNESVDYLEQLVARYPDDKEARFRLGSFYFDMRRYDDAQRLLEEALELDPYHTPALNILAYTVAIVGDEAAADSVSLRYIELEPDQWNPYDTRADILEMFGRHEEAREMFREVIRRNPTYPTPYNRLVRPYLRDGDLVGARAALQPYRDKPDGAVMTRWIESDIYVTEGRYVDAADAILGAAEKASEFGPNHFVPLGEDLLPLLVLEAGVHASATGAHEEAEETFRDLYDIDAQSVGALFGLLGVYGEQERFEEMSQVRDAAAAGIEAAPDLGRGRAESLLHFADGLIAWYRDGDAEATVRLFGEARAAHGFSMIPIRVSMGVQGEEALALIEVGRASFALEIIDSTEREAERGWPLIFAHTAWYLRGRAYEALGEPEKALESYQQLLDVAGDGVREVVLFQDTPERVARLRAEP